MKSSKMKLDNKISVKKCVVAAGLAANVDEVDVENLSGGVSSRVWKIIVKNNWWVIKQALAKLNVRDDWFSDVERIHREHEVMEALSHFLPKGSIPEVVHTDYVNHIYIM